MNTTIHEAKTDLQILMEKALSGEEVIIENDEHKAVKLVPVHNQKSKPRQPGILKGKIKLADDFNEFGPELQQMFGMKAIRRVAQSAA